MHHCPTCTCDQHDPDGVEPIRKQCGELGIVIHPGDLVAESAAARLLGYAGADALRRQAYEGRSLVVFVRRGNRRLYRLESLARCIS